MKKRTLTAVTAIMLSLLLTLGLMTGCGNDGEAAGAEGTQLAAETGVIRIKVNPDLAVTYDKSGNVIKVEGINDDGKALVQDYTGYEGRPCGQVIRELVEKMDGAGYFVEEIEGEGNKITLEIEKGSYLPGDDFLNTIVEDLEQYTVTNSVKAPVAVQGISNYGWTNYGDSDYGPDNDGVTDYDGTSNYDNASDYGQTASGGQQTQTSQTEQSQPQVQPAQPSVKPQTGGNSNYGNTNYGNTNYDDGGTTNYGSSNYDDNGNTNYGNTNYDDGGTTNYGSSNYDDGDSGYDD